VAELHDLTEAFHLKKIEREAPRMRLKILNWELDIFLRNNWNLSISMKSPTCMEDYLSQFTDLSYLTKLRPDNTRDDSMDARVLAVHLPLFKSATNIAKISAFHVTKDIVHLITHVRKVNPAAMSELSTIGDFEVFD
jgi:hypothetical protein